MRKTTRGRKISKLVSATLYSSQKEYLQPMPRVEGRVLNLPLNISKRRLLITKHPKIAIKRVPKNSIKKNKRIKNKSYSKRVDTRMINTKTDSSRIRVIATKKGQVSSSRTTKEGNNSTVVAINRAAVQDSKTAKKVLVMGRANMEESFNKDNHSFRGQDPIYLRLTIQLTIDNIMKETSSFTLNS